MLAALGAEFLIILLLILANGFFAGSELAIVSARQSRLESQAKAGSRGAKQALELAEDPDRSLATVQVGISLIGTFAAAFGGARIGDILTVWFQSIPSIAAYAEPIALGIVVVLITYLSLVLGELVPKRLALQHAERVAVLTAPIMMGLSVLARPIVALLSGSVNLVLRLIGQGRATDSLITEEDIAYMVREGTESGAVEAGEAQFIERVFQFTDRVVRRVLTPRTEITAVRVDTPWEEVVQLFLSSGYSRIPVYQESLDHVVGILHVKDVMRVLAGEKSYVDLMQLLRPATFVLESQHIDDVLAMFRRQRTHMALVIDEYGQIAGLVTLEDLLEELVGEIQDEYDQIDEQSIVQRPDGTWLVDGREAYDRVCERVGIPAGPSDEHEKFTTLAGFILSKLNRIPQAGDTLPFGDVVFEVVDMDGRRIDKVLIRLTEKTLPGEPAAEDEHPGNQTAE